MSASDAAFFRFGAISSYRLPAPFLRREYSVPDPIALLTVLWQEFTLTALAPVFFLVPGTPPRLLPKNIPR